LEVSSSTTASASTTQNDTSSAAESTSSTVYKAEDDNEFIPTSRGRRKKAKGHKGNPAAASSESLIKVSKNGLLPCVFFSLLSM
jgi:hypothetical protein